MFGVVPKHIVHNIKEFDDDQDIKLRCANALETVFDIVESRTNKEYDYDSLLENTGQFMLFVENHLI